MKTEFNMQIAVKNIIAMRRKAKPEDVAHGIDGMLKRMRNAANLRSNTKPMAFLFMLRRVWWQHCHQTIVGLPT